MNWRIGIDTGGTFTDVVGINLEEGSLFFHKVHSTPTDPGEAVCNGTLELGKRHGISPGKIETLIHGSTVATNAVLERKGARTAFITTSGFRDILIIQRQNRPRLYDLRSRRPLPVIPRAAIFEVEERTLCNGDIETPLKESDLEPVIRILKEKQFESVAIGFLNSYINPGHEIQAAEIIRKHLPDLSICLSHEVVRSQGEYERFSTCTINSYVQPKMQGYLSRLKNRLVENQVDSSLFIMKSNGGMTTAQVAGERSVETLLSGPSGGVIAGLDIAANSDRKNLITADVGGTSFDVSVIHEGKPTYASKSEINGLAINLPMVDIHTVGAGGGSIGWIDAGGALRVGPQSAGAAPGPVCYGKGGTEPTVTDANLVLGRIAAKSNLAGGMDLDLEAARKAIETRLASKLGLSVEETAEGIIQVVNARMTAAIRKLTVERGHDPETFSLCMFGGAGPLHGAELAAEMGVKEVIVPTMPGVFSAYGLLISEMREEQIQTWLKPLPETTMADLEERFESLASEAAGRLEVSSENDQQHHIIRRLQLRYHGQSHMIPVDMPDGVLKHQTIATLFHEAHKKLYGYAFENDTIEIVNLWVVVTLDIKKFAAPPYSASGDAQSGTRSVYMEGEMWETPIYNRFALAPDITLEGPAIIEQPDSTTLVLPRQEVEIDKQGSLILKTESHLLTRQKSNPTNSNRLLLNNHE